MLKKMAFANSLGAVSALCYLAMYLLSSVAPVAFKFLYNAQFYGVNVAPDKATFNVAAFVGVGVMGWLVGYVWALLYNYWA